MAGVACDAVVVGGGIAGVSVAFELAADRSVVLLEAEGALAAHSTGRSAAAYLPSYGPPPVRALTVASRPLFEQVAGAPVLSPRPMLWLATDDGSERQVAALVAERGEGFGHLEVLDADQVARLCPCVRPEVVRLAALDAAADDIDVALLHQGYTRGLRVRGGVVVVAAPVTRLARAGAGWRVQAGGQVYQAPLVVNAAGAWADRVAALAGLPALGLQPRRRTLFTAPVVAGSGLAADAPLVCDPCEGWYFKPEGQGVLASPADADPVPPGDARPSQEGVARALEGINAVTRLGLRSVRRAWGGLRTFAPDGLPVVGFRDGAPGFAYLAGQGGYGIQMAPALARFAAAVVAGADPGALGPDRLAS